jgi:hypothetical protein
VKTRQPANIAIALQILGFSAVTKIGIDAVQIHFSLEENGNISGGQLNGVIRQDEIRNHLVPPMASLFTERLNNNADLARNIIQLFHPTKDQKGHWVLAPEQLASNPLFATVLAPDVNIYDSEGNYDPKTSNPQRNCLSFGIGFTGVPVEL